MHIHQPDIVRFWLRRQHVAVLILLIVIVSIASFPYRDISADDAFITYRHTLNLVNGNGFMFNPGDRLLASTAPFHGLVLVPLALFGANSLPVLANVFSAFMLLLLCWSIYRIGSNLDYARGGLVAAVLLALNTWTYSFFPLETVMLAALELTAIRFYLERRTSLAAVLCALAVMTRQDAILVTGVLVLHHLVTVRNLKSLWRPGLVFTLLIIAWFGALTMYFGSPVPNTAQAKTGIPGHFFVFINNAWPKIFQQLLASGTASGAAVIMALVSIPIGLRGPRSADMLIMPAWGLLYVAAYSALRIIFPHGWYYFPVIVLVIVLACISAEWAYRRISQSLTARSQAGLRVLATGTLLVILAMEFGGWRAYIEAHKRTPWTSMRTQAYTETAAWLRANTSPKARIAMLEIGIIGYYSERHIVDLLGLATPQAIVNAKTDWRANITLLKPDVVVIQNRPGMNWNTPDQASLTIGDRVFPEYQLVWVHQSGGYHINIYRTTQP